ncbi:MAG: hypothetical protein IPH18_15195 [Chitinophagaceae bacterium]|nr:hypothetical protein [Chitinophagaceae bacterium]MBK8952574.1 hypothetical protein [Chitinophagaceae bacterium]
MKKLLISVFVFLVVNNLIFGQLNPQEKAVKKVFFDFLDFYKRNVKVFNSFDLWKGTGKEETPPYHIQWKEAERYFKFLRTKVRYVGEAYIAAERNDFRFYDSCYKADPDEEIVVGFDFDRWAGGQDSPDYLIKWHTDPKNIYEVKITGNSAILRIGSPLQWEGATEGDRIWHIIPFRKEIGKWKMAANISPEFSENEESEN